MITVKEFGALPDGRMVKLYTITNCHGEYVELTDFGACVHSIFVRDRENRISDVLLGVTEASELASRALEGTCIGRVGNRIKAGKCVLDGEQVQLEVNVGGNFLHGASGNYAFRMFTAMPEPDGQSVRFYLEDNGGGGFTDTVDVWLRYSFDDESRLTLHYEMIPREKTTILCPTNHAYFNLGYYGDVRSHRVRIYSGILAAKGEGNVPDGRCLDVTGTAFDFRQERSIQEGLESDVQGMLPKDKFGYDDFYVLPGSGMRLACELYAPESGRRMKTYTDMQSLIFFTPTNCANRKGKRGVVYPNYGGVCMETQFVPNAVNCHEFDSPVFRPGEKLDTTTVYAFSVEA